MQPHDAFGKRSYNSMKLRHPIACNQHIIVNDPWPLKENPITVLGTNETKKMKRIITQGEDLPVILQTPKVVKALVCSVNAD